MFQKVIYYISGSPCSGKSSISELLAEEYSFQYFKLDDFLDAFMQELAQNGNELSAKALQFSMEEMWMRDPVVMCEEEIAIYRDMLPLAFQKLSALDDDRPIIAEGAGLLLEQLQTCGVPANRVVCIVPTREFQREKYAQRTWISYYLNDCSDPAQAFENWMERDSLYGEFMLREANRLGYPAIVVDGSATVEENYMQVKKIFGLV